jgi:alkylmercury lyase
MSTTEQIDRIAAQIHHARHVRGRQAQQFALTLLRLLAEGAPVPVERLAEALELPSAQVEQTFGHWPEARRDDDGLLTAFMGLSVEEIGDHRLHLPDGRRLSAWCAWDTLFLPELLGETARVTSRCAATGQDIALTITPAGPTDLAPPATVMSFLAPKRKFGSDVINNFCRYVHFFASPEAAASWVEGHAGTFQLPIADAYRLAQLTNRATFGDALGRPIAKTG